jgi:hypothetical protein
MFDKYAPDSFARLASCTAHVRLQQSFDDQWCRRLEADRRILLKTVLDFQHTIITITFTLSRLRIRAPLYEPKQWPKGRLVVKFDQDFGGAKVLEGVYDDNGDFKGKREVGVATFM